MANNQTDASLNSLIVTYANSQTSPASTVYTYRDLDGNGVDELVFAFKPGNVFKDYMITDIYTISKDDGQSLVKDDSDSGAEKADLSDWDWKDLDSASSNSSSKTSSEGKTSSSSLKPDELKNGNYKSAVGTWKSSNGQTIKITSDGQLELWGNAYPIDKVSYVSGTYILTYIDSDPTGNTPIELCPKGVSDRSDAGDNSKDRILATNGMPSEEDYYYRVD